MDTFTSVIRELESERNQALSDNKILQAELHRLNQELKQTKHGWEVSKREVEEIKSVLKEAQHLQLVVQKKEEESMDMMKHIHYLNEEKTALEMMSKKRRADLGEAEKEIMHLRHCLQEKDRAQEETLQVLREIEGEKHLLGEQLAQCRNALQLNAIHEETLRQQLSGVYKLEAEVEERSRMIGHLQDALGSEKRASEELMQAMRGLRRDLEAACAGEEKAKAELEALHKTTQALSQELREKQEENQAMRRNVEEIRNEIQSFKKQDMTGEDLERKRQTYDAPSGDQRDKISTAFFRTRRPMNSMGESSETHSANTGRSHATRDSRLFNAYLSAAQPEPRLEKIRQTSPNISKVNDDKLRSERISMRYRMRKNDVSSCEMKKRESYE